MKGKLTDASGKISVLEMILILFIALMTSFIVYKGFAWLAAMTAHGNDSLLVNTAVSEAKVNSSNGINCVVEDCPSNTGGVCTHWTGLNETVGYMDKVTKHIVGDKPAGYNEYSEMNIDDQTFYGDPGTMVIQVTAGNGKVTASWVKGKGSE